MYFHIRKAGIFIQDIPVNKSIHRIKNRIIRFINSPYPEHWMNYIPFLILNGNFYTCPHPEERKILYQFIGIFFKFSFCQYFSQFLTKVFFFTKSCRVYTFNFFNHFLRKYFMIY